MNVFLWYIVEDNLGNFIIKLIASEVDSFRKYTMYHCILMDQGYQKTADVFLKEANEEISHILKLQQRLLFIDSMPGCDSLPHLFGQKDIVLILDEMLNMEEESIDMYYKAIKIANGMDDYGNVVFFQQILSEEESHLQWIKSQIQILNLVGPSGYLQYTGS